MFHMKYHFYFILFHSIIAVPQLNLYYTDGINENYNDLQHNCLRTAVHQVTVQYRSEMISYCMSELPSKFNVNKNDFVPKFTFADLAKDNITSQQLYLWSASIDLIEDYQYYLNKNDSILSNKIFYNCTWPRFGPKCQYELHYHLPHHSSLNEIIGSFYIQYGYDPTTLTCYEHLQCNRGSLLLCLDWSEICNGKIDCLDDGIDEKYCWQLEINQCNSNEFRCKNGQCIPQSFYQDDQSIFDCIDGSDEALIGFNYRITCLRDEFPSIACEDAICERQGLTNSCAAKRVNILKESMYSSKDNSLSEDCWLAFKCLYNIFDFEYLSCDQIDKQKQIVNNTCPDMIYFPGVPVLFGNLYFAFAKNDLQYSTNINQILFYICYNNSHYDDYLINVSRILFQNMKCIYPERFWPQSHLSSLAFIVTNYEDIIGELYVKLKRYHLIFNYTSVICNRSNMYQCSHSVKCISIYRLLDNIYDCPYMDDENMNGIKNISLIEHFKCQSTNKYIPKSSVGNKYCDCGYNEMSWCEDEDLHADYLQKNIVFQHICDGFIELSSIMIAGRNETDETECEQWKCNNIYTRCNDIWNCPNGEDESDCLLHLSLICSSDQHLCVLPDTNQLICLSIDKANDGKIDCLGATDEPTLCGTKIPSNTGAFHNDFYCRNQSDQPCISNLYLCNGNKQCKHGDDEQFCTTNRTKFEEYTICTRIWVLTSVEQFLCDYRTPTRRWKIINFKLDKMFMSIEDRKEKNIIDNSMFSISSSVRMIDQPRCHRGLDLRVWLNKNSTKNTCLCPLSYYGEQCQYQNQRIGLTIRFRALSDSSQTLFTIVVSLIDDSNDRIIHSYEQIIYLLMKHCKTKFSIPLLYSTRPKDPTKNYAIHIDFYEKVPLAYRGSVLLPITFPFLPVHRLAFIIDIPGSNHKIQSCINDQCLHGKCIKYSNNQDNYTFCQCDRGWTGKYCSIQHICTCSSDSLCIGISANNRSICVCPTNKFGPRCLLNETACQISDNLTCENNGQCIANDNYMVFRQNFICICQKGFSGDRCEIADTKLNLLFNKDLPM